MAGTLEVARDILVDFADIPIPLELDSPVVSSHLVTLSGIIRPPSWSKFTTAYLNVLDVSGGTNTVDLAFSYLDPVDNETLVAFPGSGITQVVAPGLVVVQFDPAAADDDTGPIYTLHKPSNLPISYALKLGTKAEHEVQTLTLTAGAEDDTFTLTFNTHASDPVTIPATDYEDVTAAQIKAALLTISDWVGLDDDIAVVKTLNEYAITFTGTLGAADVGAITVTDKTGTADGSVAETNKGVVGDETYEATLAFVFSP